MWTRNFPSYVQESTKSWHCSGKIWPQKHSRQGVSPKCWGTFCYFHDAITQFVSIFFFFFLARCSVGNHLSSCCQTNKPVMVNFLFWCFSRNLWQGNMIAVWHRAVQKSFICFKQGWTKDALNISQKRQRFNANTSLEIQCFLHDSSPNLVNKLKQTFVGKIVLISKSPREKNLFLKGTIFKFLKEHPFL